MNDYWNDPHDYPEPPEWWMNLDDAMEDETMPESVKKAIKEAMDEWASTGQEEYDPGPEPDFSDDDFQNHYAIKATTCPHGRAPHNCDDCDYLGDIAYDAAREARHFNR
jgi:hypothetical protein